MIRRIARFSRITLVAIALIGLVVLTVVGLFGEKVLRGQVEVRMSEALGRKVTVGALSVNLAARTVELRNVIIPGLPASKRPTLIAPRIRLALSFRSLFTSKILLRGLDLEKPQISVQVFEDGSTDLPQTAASNAPATRSLTIARVSLIQVVDLTAAFEVADLPVPQLMQVQHRGTNDIFVVHHHAVPLLKPHAVVKHHQGHPQPIQHPVILPGQLGAHHDDTIRRVLLDISDTGIRMLRVAVARIELKVKPPAFKLYLVDDGGNKALVFL